MSGRNRSPAKGVGPEGPQRFESSTLRMLYKLSVEDIEKLEKFISGGFKADDINYIGDCKALKELMTKYNENGYVWTDKKSPFDFNPWTLWVDAEGYIIGVYNSKIWCAPMGKEDFEAILEHKI